MHLKKKEKTSTDNRAYKENWSVKLYVNLSQTFEPRLCSYSFDRTWIYFKLNNNMEIRTYVHIFEITHFVHRTKLINASINVRNV